MAHDSSLNKTAKTNHRRRRTKFTDEQLKILINAFNQKPYPGYATKQRLALEVNMEESRIQIWFQNRRAKHRLQERSAPEESSQGHPEEMTQIPSPAPGREGRRSRTDYSAEQLRTLTEAFSRNPYPGIQAREQLAKDIDVPESRVQVWFQNRRSRFHIHIKKEPDQDLEQRED